MKGSPGYIGKVGVLPPCGYWAYRDLEGRLTVNDEELAIRAAVDGVGVLYTALGYAAPEIKAGRLVPLLEDWRIGLGRILSVLSEPATGTGAAAGVHRVPAGELAGALRREGVRRHQAGGGGRRHTWWCRRRRRACSHSPGRYRCRSPAPRLALDRIGRAPIGSTGSAPGHFAIAA